MVGNPSSKGRRGFLLAAVFSLGVAHKAVEVMVVRRQRMVDCEGGRNATTCDVSANAAAAADRATFVDDLILK